MMLPLTYHMSKTTSNLIPLVKSYHLKFNFSHRDLHTPFSKVFRKKLKPFQFFLPFLQCFVTVSYNLVQPKSPKVCLSRYSELESVDTSAYIKARVGLEYWKYSICLRNFNLECNKSSLLCTLSFTIWILTRSNKSKIPLLHLVYMAQLHAFVCH